MASFRPTSHRWGVRTAVVLSLSALLAGCVTREDIRGIQTDLYNIKQGIDTRLGSVKDQTDTVQTTQADLLQEMKQLDSNLTALQTELQDSRLRMEKLAVRLDDLEASLTARMDSQIELLSGSKFVENPLPSTVYNLANTDFTRGRMTEAIREFQDYIKRFPKGEKVSEAKLKIADAHAKQKDSALAIQAYEDLIKASPKDPLVPTALLKEANYLLSLNKESEAKEIYIQIIETFPNRSEAELAQEKLRSLQVKPQQ